MTTVCKTITQEPLQISRSIRQDPSIIPTCHNFPSIPPSSDPMSQAHQKAAQHACPKPPNAPNQNHAPLPHRLRLHAPLPRLHRLAPLRLAHSSAVGADLQPGPAESPAARAASRGHFFLHRARRPGTGELVCEWGGLEWGCCLEGGGLR